jgi:Flp pilus assembly protein TadG
MIMRNLRRNGEKGTTMAEFAIISVVFFMIIFAIIEFGRLFYIHNALTDAARRGARYGALHGEDKLVCAQRVVIYGESRVNPDTCVATGSPLISGLTEANVTVTYEGADADNNPATPPTEYGMNLGTCSVVIHDYTFRLAIPFVPKTLTMPSYVTTLTAESAGEKPDDL